MSANVKELRSLGKWNTLRTTAVITDELTTSAAVAANTFAPKTPFVDIFVFGTLSATTTIDINIVDVNDSVAGGTNAAYPVKHAFKDGSSKVTVATNSVIPMVTATPKMGVMIDGEVGAASVKVNIREV